MSAKRELLQVASYSKVNSRPWQEGSYLWLDEFILKIMAIQTQKTHPTKLSEIPKKVSFQVENHSVGKLMPKASQPWERNEMILDLMFSKRKGYCTMMFRKHKTIRGPYILTERLFGIVVTVKMPILQSPGGYNPLTPLGLGP